MKKTQILFRELEMIFIIILKNLRTIFHEFGSLTFFEMVVTMSNYFYLCNSLLYIFQKINFPRRIKKVKLSF